MSLLAVYKRYLESKGDKDTLSPAASLQYIPTLTTIKTPDKICDHHIAQSKILRTVAETVLHHVESEHSLGLEVETKLHFVSDGGAYLPGVESNFLTDRTAVFPVIHFVQFDINSKIRQIRQYWDQASLLRTMDVLGAKARNWPVRDSKDQLLLVASSIGRSSEIEPSTSADHGGRHDSSVEPSSTLNIFHEASQSQLLKDMAKVPGPRGSSRPQPRSYGELFASEDTLDRQSELRSGSPEKTIGSKAAAAKPPARQYEDLFVCDDSSDNISGARSDQPNTKTQVAPKIGAGKNFKPSRLFSLDDDEESLAKSPDKHDLIKTNPRKYDHFEFGAGEDAPKRTDSASATAAKSKHQSQWQFEDFVTPQKQMRNSRAGMQMQSHWESNEDDSRQANESRTVRLKTRPRDVVDSNTRTESVGSRASQSDVKKEASQWHTSQNKPERSDVPPAPRAEEFRTTLQGHVKNREKDFEPHFDICDSLPSKLSISKGANESHMASTRESSTGPVKMPTGDSVSSQKENQALSKPLGIKSGGDGMGGRKGAIRSWDFGDFNAD